MDEELPRLTVETWHEAVPPAAVPVPAQHVPELPTARAVAVVPGHGVVSDLRILGEAQPDGDGVTRVDLVPELDYWRTRIIPGTPVMPRRLELTHVWVEHRLNYDPDAEHQAQQLPSPGDARALLRRVAPAPDQPGSRVPVPARTVPYLHGRRIIQVTPLGFAWDLRAVSEPYQDIEGEIMLNLASAWDYYRWLLTGTPSDPVPVPLYTLWTE